MLPDLVVRPGSTEETARAVALLARERKAMVPRGAGLSYTAGAVPHAPATVIDSARLDAIEINAHDLYAVVGAGCTWAKLAVALKPHGLRAVQINPISGSDSTVGGTASQNIPGGMDGIIGLTVVLADGSVARTGSGARKGASPFQRYSGPDLTGMFLGDCGAFGVKTEVVLRLAAERPAAFASFAFADADDLVAAMVPLLKGGLVSRALRNGPGAKPRALRSLEYERSDKDRRRGGQGRGLVGPGAERRGAARPGPHCASEPSVVAASDC